MDVKAVLVINDRLFSGIVETGGTITFGSGKKDTVQVEGYAAKQITVINRPSGLSVKGINIDQNNVPMESVVIIDEASQSYMYFTTLIRTSLKKYKVPYRGTIKLGRNQYSNEIVIDLPFISRDHLVLKCDSGSIRVEDLDSSIGTFINGKRISIGKLTPGDELNILSLTIKYSNGELTFIGVNEDLTLKEAKDQTAESVMDESDPDKLVFHKSPRVQESLPSQPVIIANPPSKGQKYEKCLELRNVISEETVLTKLSVQEGIPQYLMLARKTPYQNLKEQFQMYTKLEELAGDEKNHIILTP